MSSSSDVRFVHPNGRANVRPDLDAMLRGANRSLRAAVCFFTEPGRVLLSRHVSQLKQADSYFIASVDTPTNLKSLENLHNAAPGHVYIHLGGTTPEEKTVGRSLMHSKVFLAEGNQDCSLWVGSHNLTAMAVGGGNFEAGLMCTAPADSPVMQDAISHLEACRVTAEQFDPRDMERYQEIQRRHREESDWDSERSVLVIHAEASQMPTQLPFIVHINVVPIELDRLFRLDRPVRLFLHTSGTLRLRTPVDYRRATLWTGELTAVVRTERHPKNRGARGEFALANYNIDIPSLTCFPTLTPSGQSSVTPRTQVVIRLDQLGKVGAELFSIGGRSPVENALASAHALELHEVDGELARYFTPESVDGHTLIYRPVTGVQQNLVVTGYEETVRSRIPGQHEETVAPYAEENAVSDAEDEPALFPEDRPKKQPKAPTNPHVPPDADDRIQYRTTAPKHPLDPFFFLSNYAVRPRRHE